MEKEKRRSPRRGGGVLGGGVRILRRGEEFSEEDSVREGIGGGVSEVGGRVRYVKTTMQRLSANSIYMEGEFEEEEGEYDMEPY